MNEKGKEGSFTPIFVVMGITVLIALFWESFPLIKNSVASILDPTAGFLLTWNITWGMLIIVAIISLIITIVQKYATDQETLREMKNEQKILQEEMKKFKDHPEKLMELQKKQFEFIPKTMKLSMRVLVYTGIPFILFFRWFNDFFIEFGSPKFFGIMNWFVFYLLFSIIFGSLFRKIFKVV